MLNQPDPAITLDDTRPGITDVPGFEAAGVAADIRGKNDQRLDLALIVSRQPCTAAGVFTTNDVKAPPVRVCQARLDAQPQLHGIVANSGNANACTGEQGQRDAVNMAQEAARACGLPDDSFLVCSTGRIGVALPMERLLQGIHAAAPALGNTSDQGVAAARAIMTSDTRPKHVTARFTWEGQTITVGGIAKGAGMIEPNMATMLAFIATDIGASRTSLQQQLARAVRGSFNAITVDGDMSTNDTVLVLANHASGLTLPEDPGAPLALLFQEALRAVCAALAEKIVGDGEKITKVVALVVKGAPDEAAAEKVARAIGNSLLVKSSWYGNDPNWGRLADAAGYARIGLVESKLNLYYDDVPVLLAGTPCWDKRDAWKAIVSRKHFSITLDLQLGSGAFRLLASDLSEAYVNFNKSE